MLLKSTGFLAGEHRHVSGQRQTVDSIYGMKKRFSK